jgi:hypothetical protein
LGVDDRLFTTSAIYAGNSVPWGINEERDCVGDDAFNGTRVMIELSDGKYRFYDEATVTVSAEIVITENVSIGDISVGSSIAVVGGMVDDATDVAVYDASQPI